MARHGVLALIQMVAVVGALGAALIVDPGPAMPATVEALPAKPAPAAEPVRHFAEPPPPRVGACDGYLQAIDRYARCEAVPEDARAALREARADFVEQIRAVPEEQLPSLIEACGQASEAIAQAMPALDC
jgi:hypothetical protein